MSRGAGRLQRQILGALVSRAPVLVNELRWDLARVEDKVRFGRRIAGIRQGAIERTFCSGFNRAVAKLRQKGRVAVTSRKLTGLDELIRLYPFKTTDLGVRELREKLLPSISSYLAIARRDGRFKATGRLRTEREEYLLGLAAPAEQKQIRLRWSKEIEPNLFKVLTAAQDQLARRDLALRVIQRGRELFELGPGSDPALMAMLLQKGLASQDPMDRAVYTQAWSLYRQAIPEARLRHAKLKTQLYAVADFWTNTPVSLKGPFLDALALWHPFILELPGHEPPIVKFGRTVRSATFSPILHRLLHRNVFSQFSFLAVASA